MAYERYTRTNQKLYFAGLTLQSLAKAEQGGAIDAPARTQAEREAAVFHLYGALLALCHEIAGFYHLANDAAPRAQAYLTEQVLQQAANPELAELVELTLQRDTWLSQLLAEHDALFQPPREPAKPKHDVTQPLIQAINLDAADEPVALTAETLETWRQHLKTLAVRFRNGLSEC